tara:strand:+ start:263 stop:595 length:333 start_codon:yes stop_codon:yes gene_type:complete
MIGVYAFIPDMRGKYGIDVDYIGVSKNLEARIKDHFRNRKPYASTISSGHIIYQQLKDKDKAECYESSLIEEFKPAYNRSTGREHRILYPHFYEVKNIKNVLRQIEQKPW